VSGGRKIVVVAGLGRCGLSLVMQMLEAGGLPCAGEFPDYEPDEVNHRAVDEHWLGQWQAVKILDPHLTPLPPDLDAVVIWLDRNVDEQARSQQKLLRLTTDWKLSPSRQQRGAWKRSLKSDRKRARRALARYPCIEQRFEDLIGEPAAAALMLEHALERYGIAVCAEDMAECVLPRASRCRPDLGIEAMLVEYGPGAAKLLQHLYPQESLGTTL